MDSPGLAWRAFCLVGFATSRNGVSKREGSGSVLVDYCVGQGLGFADAVQERRFEGTSGRTKMAVDERCQVPRVWWMCSGGACRSEYTKMGGCVGLRLSRVTWSYVLALGGGIPIPNSPFSILTYGHRGLVRTQPIVHVHSIYTRYCGPVWSRLKCLQVSPGQNRYLVI